MRAPYRQWWDTVNDRPSLRKRPLAEEAKRHRQALEQPIAEFRAKRVLLSSGEVEYSITPTNKKGVIDARMGFNPLLDLAPKRRSPEEQEQRDKENRQRSAKRARQRVRYLIKAISADHMLTFSTRENITDKAEFLKVWAEFSRLFHQRHPKWQYVAVPELQDRGAYHLHVAVRGRQDLRFALYCWLRALGQDHEELTQWYVHGVKLGERSLGAVNVEPPKRRWGGTSKHWKTNKLAAYLTKYFAKEFGDSAKGSKNYWHSKSIEQPRIARFYLKAQTWSEAVNELYNLAKFDGVDYCEMWGDCDAGVLWFTGVSPGKVFDRPAELELDDDETITEIYHGEF